MKKLFTFCFVALSFMLFSCSSDYGSKEKTPENSIEDKGYGGAKTEPSRGTVVSDDSVAAENPTGTDESTGEPIKEEENR